MWINTGFDNLRRLWPASNYDEEEVNLDLEKFYRKERTFFKDYEIDHIILNRKFGVTKVAVVPKFYTESDHRLLRASLR
uniref:Endo/exonuclease/phosphatase domain-containing protein n=1 Tax=Angiostrongylus cantonensis TaxID=6313 RepID=A0A0K0DAS1_ANGCA